MWVQTKISPDFFYGKVSSFTRFDFSRLKSGRAIEQAAWPCNSKKKTTIFKREIVLQKTPRGYLKLTYSPDTLSDTFARQPLKV